MYLGYFMCILLCSYALSIPIEDSNESQNLNRVVRSPTFRKKRPVGVLGGLAGGGYGTGGGANYITNINNYGPSQAYPQQTYNPHQTLNYGHGSGSSFAGSAAVAGGTGGHSQTQSQSASFSYGPYSASFSQSQAQSGRIGNNYYDY